jgi:GNAT superfamily N-acetyltransferase
MFRIRPAAPSDHDQVLDLLCRLQASPCHHIGFHGDTSAEVADELVGLRWPAATVVAVDASDHVRGVLSVGVRPGQGRAWWYGPFVDVPAEHPAADRIWQRTADALYSACTALPILRGCTETELYGHVEHRRLAAFAQRHGFPAGDYSSLLVLSGVDLVRLIGAVPPGQGTIDIRELPVPPTAPTPATSLIRMHDRYFPDAYLSSAGLLSGVSGRTVVVATEGDRLLGYAAGGVQPQDYFVDFVAVATGSRNHGLGAALVTTLVQRLAELHGARESAYAVIAGGNAPSRRMLHTLGFRPDLELVSYRLRATRLVA